MAEVMTLEDIHIHAGVTARMPIPGGGTTVISNNLRCLAECVQGLADHVIRLERELIDLQDSVANVIRGDDE